MRWRLKSPASLLFFKRLIRRKSKKTSKLRVTGLCEGNSPVTGEFPHKGPVTRKMFPFDGVIMPSMLIQWLCADGWWCGNTSRRRFKNGVPQKFGLYDDVIKWNKMSLYWPFVRRIRRPPVNSPHKGQWRGTLMFSLICAWTNGWINNRDVGDLRRHRFIMTSL